MNQKKFLTTTVAAVVVADGGYYLSTDKRNFTRADMKVNPGVMLPATWAIPVNLNCCNK